MQFGFVSSSAVSAPSAFFTASVRAAANETPFATSGRISELNTSECKYSAQCMRGAVSPVSLPNVSVSTQPSAFNNEMQRIKLANNARNLVFSNHFIGNSLKFT